MRDNYLPRCPGLIYWSLSIAVNQCYLVREDEDVDDVEDGAENADGDSQVAVYFLVILQHLSLFPF